MGENRTQTYSTLQEAIGADHAANLVSALLSSELCDDLMGVIGDDADAAEEVVTLLNALLDKGCHAEILSMLKIMCAIVGREYPEEVSAVEQSPIELKGLLSEMVSDFEDILTQEYN